MQNPSRAFQTNAPKKTLPETNAGVAHEVIADWYLKQDLSTEEIAKRIGCTRQRVGQILRGLGVDVMAHGRRIRDLRAHKKAEARKARESARSSKRQQADNRNWYGQAVARYQGWMIQWSEGKTLKDIALTEGKPVESVKATIWRLRRRYGWFPTRYTKKVTPQNDFPKIALD